MNNKFISIILALGLGYSSVSYASPAPSPVVVGVLLGGAAVAGATYAVKCGTVRDTFDATQVQAPYTTLPTSSIAQAKAAKKGQMLKIAGEFNVVEIIDIFHVKHKFTDQGETLEVQLSKNIVCSTKGGEPQDKEKLYLYGKKNSQGGLDVIYWEPQNPLERQTWNYRTEYDYPSFQVLQQAAQMDLPYPQFLLAKAYYDGKLTTKDDKKAFEWAKKSYDNQVAQNVEKWSATPLLGIFYAEGKVVPQDYTQAKKFFDNTISHHWDSINSSRQPDKKEVAGFEELYGKAFYTYGMMYYQGQGVKKDIDTAMSLFYKVMEHRSEYAIKYKPAETMYVKLYREKYNKLYVPYDENFAHAMYFYRANINALPAFEDLGREGNADAQVMAGVIYSEGKFVPRNVAKAKEWYLKAAEQGHLTAIFNLGVIYYNDEDNLQKAKYYFKKACDGGNEEGCKMLKEIE